MEVWHMVDDRYDELSGQALSGTLSPLLIAQSQQQQQQSAKVFNPEAFCEICQKEFCNKYYLQTHRATKHGISSAQQQQCIASASSIPGGISSSGSSGSAAVATATAGMMSSGVTGTNAAAVGGQSSSSSSCSFTSPSSSSASGQRAAALNNNLNLASLSPLLATQQQTSPVAMNSNSSNPFDVQQLMLASLDPTLAANNSLRALYMSQLAALSGLQQQSSCSSTNLETSMSPSSCLISTTSASSTLTRNNSSINGTINTLNDNNITRSFIVNNFIILTIDMNDFSMTATSASPSTSSSSLSSSTAPTISHSSTSRTTTTTATTITTTNNNNQDSSPISNESVPNWLAGFMPQSTVALSPANSIQTAPNCITPPSGTSAVPSLLEQMQLMNAAQMLSSASSLQQQQSLNSNSNGNSNPLTSTATSSSILNSALINQPLNALAAALCQQQPSVSSSSSASTSSQSSACSSATIAPPLTPNSAAAAAAAFFAAAGNYGNSPAKDAYCELCDKNFCNRYFLKTHRQKKHGITDESSSPIKSFPASPSNAQLANFPFQSSSQLGALVPPTTSLALGNAAALAAMQLPANLAALMAACGGASTSTSCCPATTASSLSLSSAAAGSRSQSNTAGIINASSSTATVPFNGCLLTSGTAAVNTTGNAAADAITSPLVHQQFLAVATDTGACNNEAVTNPFSVSSSSTCASVSSSTATCLPTATIQHPLAASVTQQQQQSVIVNGTASSSNDYRSSLLLSSPSAKMIKLDSSSTDRDRERDSSAFDETLATQDDMMMLDDDNNALIMDTKQLKLPLDSLLSAQFGVGALGGALGNTPQATTNELMAAAAAAATICDLCNKSFPTLFSLLAHKAREHMPLASSVTNSNSLNSIENITQIQQQQQQQQQQRDAKAKVHFRSPLKTSQSPNQGGATAATAAAVGLSGNVADEKIACEMCEKEFESRHYLQQHILIHHSGIANASSLLSNFLPAGLALPFILPPNLTHNFPITEADQTNLLAGLNAHINPSQQPKQAVKRQYSSSAKNYCDLCNKEVCNKYFLRTHMLKMHGIVIDENKTVIANIDTLEKEKMGTLSFRCDICMIELKSRNLLRSHKQEVHGVLAVQTQQQSSANSNNNSSSSNNNGRTPKHSITSAPNMFGTPQTPVINGQLTDKITECVRLLVEYISSVNGISNGNGSKKSAGRLTIRGWLEGKRNMQFVDDDTAVVAAAVAAAAAATATAASAAEHCEPSEDAICSQPTDWLEDCRTERCPLCDYRCKSIVHLQEHIQEKHATDFTTELLETFQKVRQFLVLLLPFLLIFSLNSSANKMNYKCDLCSEVFNDELQRHVHIIHKHRGQQLNIKGNLHSGASLVAAAVAAGEEQQQLLLTSPSPSSSLKMFGAPSSSCDDLDVMKCPQALCDFRTQHAENLTIHLQRHAPLDAALNALAQRSQTVCNSPTSDVDGTTTKTEATAEEGAALMSADKVNGVLMNEQRRLLTADVGRSIGAPSSSTLRNCYSQEELDELDMDEEDDAMRATTEVALKMAEENEVLYKIVKLTKRYSCQFAKCQQRFATKQLCREHVLTHFRVAAAASGGDDGNSTTNIKNSMDSKTSSLCKTATAIKAKSPSSMEHRFDSCAKEADACTSLNLEQQQQTESSSELMIDDDKMDSYVREEREHVVMKEDLVVTTTARASSRRDDMVLVNNCGSSSTTSSVHKEHNERHSHTSGSMSPISEQQIMPEGFARPLDNSASQKPYMVQSFIMREHCPAILNPTTTTGNDNGNGSDNVNDNLDDNGSQLVNTGKNSSSEGSRKLNSGIVQEMIAHLPVRSLLTEPVIMTVELVPAPHIDAQVMHV
ncbi:unnamed protein product [Anisakis simplex]|uniref:C2H2-type domain-containing protein n=1 Tax=Anisakis simplex TaxID=6269 RepID=A0A158PMU9_ANISI|nr:unnamed protein product [Anisakis simplex]